jgi:peptide/nickel transport system permease protein
MNVMVNNWQKVKFFPENSWKTRLRSLGPGRVIFVALFSIFYSLLLSLTFVNKIDPHERFRYEKEVLTSSQNLLSPGGITGGVREFSGFRVYAEPTGKHWLGTDDRGRDLLTRLAYGARTVISTGLVCVLFFAFAGVVFGVIAGYSEGRWQILANYFFSIVNTFPILLLLLLSVIIIGTIIGGEWIFLRIYFLMACLGFFSSPKLAELIRGRIASLREMTFVQAAEALGLRPYEIIGKHILWYECRPLIIVQCAYMMGQAVLVETTLTYLNFGLEYPDVSWGLMFRTMASGIMTGKYQPVVVMFMIAMTVYFFQYLAGILNDILSNDERNN